MNQSKIQDMLLDLKAKQYIESDVTHTLSQNSIPLISISYSKSDHVFKIHYSDNHEIQSYANIDAAVDAITSELNKHK
ncbi:hypothetical protein LCY76_06045 [Fictibacillus sp. KIGAM418]|uniref:Uncharacterized protein n=1 Tax=Fictibacillus marinisediminis TaxID=2878389 RepID=A0A9X1XB50_9BACL|nr:hypothetical protein [Fictibacillus marinisediminis]MCK6256163.1 hypothetical protein [Fictibacillus marinisediminis]